MCSEQCQHPDLGVTAQPAWSLSTCTRILLGVRCSAKIWVKSGYFLKNLPKPLKIAPLGPVRLTSPRARFFTMCEMSGRSCDRYAARITHDRYMSLRSLFLGLDFWIPASAGPPTSSHRVCPLLLLFPDPTLGSKDLHVSCPVLRKLLVNRCATPLWSSDSENGFLGRHLPRTLKCGAVSARMHSATGHRSPVILGCRSTPGNRHRVRRFLFHHFHNRTRFRLNGLALCWPIPASWCNDPAKYCVRPAFHTWTSSIDHIPSHQVPCTTHLHRV